MINTFYQFSLSYNPVLCRKTAPTPPVLQNTSIRATMAFYVQKGRKVIPMPHTDMFTLPFIMLADDNDM